MIRITTLRAPAAPPADHRCPYCRQRLPEIRLGVKLSDLKARIFDLVMRGGDYGVAVEDLNAIVFAGRKLKQSTLRAHVAQINEAIELSGYRILSSRTGLYRLVNIRGGRSC